MVAKKWMKKVGNDHRVTGWGERFYKWLFKEGYDVPYNSMGNGAGMRISPVGWVAKTEEEVKMLSKKITEISHNHEEGIKGAEAIAMAVFLAREGKSKAEIKERMIGYYPAIKDSPKLNIRWLLANYGYDPSGKWVTCEGSVPQAIVCFLDSVSYEDAVRNAVSLGGDGDTQACIAGAIAEAFYGIPDELQEEAWNYVDEELQEYYLEYADELYGN
jgi:type I restriction enzyme M protein